MTHVTLNRPFPSWVPPFPVCSQSQRRRSSLLYSTLFPLDLRQRRTAGRWPPLSSQKVRGRQVACVNQDEREGRGHVHASRWAQNDSAFGSSVTRGKLSAGYATRQAAPAASGAAGQISTSSTLIVSKRTRQGQYIACPVSLLLASRPSHRFTAASPSSTSDISYSTLLRSSPKAAPRSYTTAISHRLILLCSARPTRSSR